MNEIHQKWFKYWVWQISTSFTMTTERIGKILSPQREREQNVKPLLSQARSRLTAMDYRPQLQTVTTLDKGWGRSEVTHVGNIRLTTWSRVLPEIWETQVGKISPAFNKSQRWITTFTTARFWTLSSIWQNNPHPAQYMLHNVNVTLPPIHMLSKCYLPLAYCNWTLVWQKRNAPSKYASPDQKRNAQVEHLCFSHDRAWRFSHGSFIKAFSNSLVSDWHAVSALKGRTTAHMSEAVYKLNLPDVGETHRSDYTGLVSKAKVSM